MIRTFNKSLRMATALAALVSGAVLVATAGVSPAQAQGGYGEPSGEVDLDTFYRELGPYGDWFSHPRYGTVWRPHVDAGWRPYTRGYWANSEEHGWVWVAEEEWGWAPFHYGRWAYDEDEEEWLWIPGTEWAPAWVMWRQSDDLVGWAPLPPDAIWEPGYGLRFNASVYESPRYYSYWSFVRPEHMFVPSLYRYLVPRDRYRTFWGRTTWVRDHHRFVGGRVYHGGVDRRWVEGRAGRSVPLVSLRTVNTPREQGWRAGRNPSEIPIFRPRVTSLPQGAPPDWVRRGPQDRRGPAFDRGGDGPDRRGPPDRRGFPDRRGPDVRPSDGGGRGVNVQPDLRNRPADEPRFDRRRGPDGRGPDGPVQRQPERVERERPPVQVQPRFNQPPPQQPQQPRVIGQQPPLQQPGPPRDVRRPEARPPQAQPQPAPQQPSLGRQPPPTQERRAPQQREPYEPRG